MPLPQTLEARHFTQFEQADAVVGEGALEFDFEGAGVGGGEDAEDLAVDFEAVESVGGGWRRGLGWGFFLVFWGGGGGGGGGGG